MLRLKRAPTPDVISRRSDNRDRPAACATVYSCNDTLVADLSADDGELRAHGISLHPYTFPLVTLRLPKGAKGRITVRHMMQRENLTGIESVGLRLP